MHSKVREITERGDLREAYELTKDKRVSVTGNTKSLYESLGRGCAFGMSVLLCTYK